MGQCLGNVKLFDTRAASWVSDSVRLSDLTTTTTTQRVAFPPEAGSLFALMASIISRDGFTSEFAYMVSLVVIYFETRDATDPVNIVHGTEGELALFLVLNMWPSHFGLPLLLAIILLSKRVHRHPTFVNLCVGFIIVGM
jgi:hypothetical protein